MAIYTIPKKIYDALVSVITGTRIDATIQEPLSVDDNGGSLTVDGTFWQVTQPVSGTFWPVTQPVSGTFWQVTQPVSGTFWQVTQPVSATDLDIRDLVYTSDDVTVYQHKADTMAYGAVSVGVAATAILASSASRTGLIIQNLSTADVYIGGDAVSLANGIKLNPGDIYENQDWTGAVYGIATAAASDVRFEQFYTA